MVEPGDYDHVIVAFSGGKDSLACLLHLLELAGRAPSSLFERGAPSSLELWHHDVDDGRAFMDWPVTPGYCRAVAEFLRIPIYFSARKGGFYAEMMREEQPTGAVTWQEPGGRRGTKGGRSPKLGTRLKFPQKSADLSVRWCSAYLKIDVCATAIRNQPRFTGKKTLVVTGERGEESSARAKYKVFEDHRANARSRTVHQWRPILEWPEKEVWSIIERWMIRPHPAYQLGWGRVSCASCIFGSKDQWASLHAIAPHWTKRLHRLEKRLGVKIDRKRTVREMVEAGEPYPSVKSDVAWFAMQKNYPLSVVMDPWELPAGAFGDSAGPT